jgi:hypothetical protein
MKIPDTLESTRIKSSKKSPNFKGNTSPIPAMPVFLSGFIEPVSTFTASDFQGSAYRWKPLPTTSDFDKLV